MPSLHLPFQGLAFTFDLDSREVETPGGPYLDWLNGVVIAEAPYFRGQFPWSVMPSELRELASSLQVLYDIFPAKGHTTFEPTEPNVRLSFAVSPTGSIAGEFRLTPDCLASGYLQGTFALDQSSLPGVVRNIQRFLEESSEA